MEEFFRSIPRNMERQVQGLGSGFAIDENGFVVTNEHVVSGADSIVVTDAQGSRLRAELVGADALTDIAVLKVEGGRIPPAPLGTSSDLMVGEPAIAIGNPLGYFLANGEATVTAGVISGIARDIRDEDNDGSLFADMIQTDAAINPGNSGGALVNAEGRVIGVNSSILSRSGGSEGLGFAIPIDRALRIAGELRDFGRIRRPWIGVDPEIVASDTSLFSSTRIRRVAGDSPAETAGLVSGDVLLEVNGRHIDSPLDLEVGLLDAGVGSEIEVVYERAGQQARTRLAVVELPSEQAARVEVLSGLQLVTVNDQIAIERGLPQEIVSGALIVEITPENSRFSGLLGDDVIVAINRQRVHTAEDADDLFRSFAGGSRIWATVVRNGRLVNTSSFYVR
jgi:serine protease Do